MHCFMLHLASLNHSLCHKNTLYIFLLKLGQFLMKTKILFKKMKTSKFSQLTRIYSFGFIYLLYQEFLLLDALNYVSSRTCRKNTTRGVWKPLFLALILILFIWKLSNLRFLEFLLEMYKAQTPLSLLKALI